MDIAPSGEESSTKFVISDQAPTAPLPGSISLDSPVLPVPDLPGSKPVPFTPAPAFWSDAGRIIADVLKLYAENPAEAIVVWDFAKAKLAAIGKS